MRFCLVLAIVIFVSGQILACPKYNRKDYRHWIDEDRDCQNTRNEVLIQESLDPVYFKSSKAFLGFISRWTNRSWCDPRCDNLIRLKPIWRDFSNKTLAFHKKILHETLQPDLLPDILLTIIPFLTLDLYTNKY